MLTVNEYRDALLASLTPRPPARVRLQDAAGLVLAEDVWAPRDFPISDTAAVDGFAVTTDELAGPTAARRPVMSGEPLSASDAAVVALGDADPDPTDPEQRIGVPVGSRPGSGNRVSKSLSIARTDSWIVITLDSRPAKTPTYGSSDLRPTEGATGTRKDKSE